MMPSPSSARQSLSFLHLSITILSSLLLLLLPKICQSRRGPYGTCIPNVDCTPPMGWRTWNAYYWNVNQTIVMNALTSMSVLRDATTGVIMNTATTTISDEEKGMTTTTTTASFTSLGYNDAGLDDNWQACHTGVQGTFHNKHGEPLVNHTLFPNLKSMTNHAKSLNIKMGWYANNCICPEKCHHNNNHNYDHDWDNFYCFTNETKPTLKDVYDGDAKATIVSYGFESIKLDGCGQLMDLDLYYDALEHSSFSFLKKGILIENCHWGWTVPTLDWCPFSYFRTSGDIFDTFDSVWGNVQSVVPYSLEVDGDGNEVSGSSGGGGKTLSRPGCWAYPDMMMVGHLANFEEDRSHFGLWCITSSPLILGHDITNETLNKQIWPIISNREAINVNQAWHGHPGKLVFNHSRSSGEENLNACTSFSSTKVVGDDPNSNDNEIISQIWMKPLNDTTMALLFVSNGNSSEKVQFPAFHIKNRNKKEATFSVRSIWDNKDLSTHRNYYQPEPLAVRDSHFLLVTLEDSLDGEEDLSSLPTKNSGSYRGSHGVRFKLAFTFLWTAGVHVLSVLNANILNYLTAMNSGDDDATTHKKSQENRNYLSFDHFEFCR